MHTHVLSLTPRMHVALIAARLPSDVIVIAQWEEERYVASGHLTTGSSSLDLASSAFLLPGKNPPQEACWQLPSRREQAFLYVGQVL